MPKELISCPNCKTKIDVTEAMTASMRAEIKRDFESTQAQTWQLKLSQLEVKLKQQNVLNVHSEQQKVDGLQKQLTQEQYKARQAQQNELKLRAQANQLQAREREMDLEVARKLDQGRETLREQLGAEHDLKLKQKQQQIDGLKNALGDAKRRAEQGSQETQGEALELSLEADLTQMFPLDEIVPVSKGARGADVLQTVRNSQGQDCGKILRKVKNTKHWSGGWIQKLKDDQRAANAQSLYC